MTRQTWTYMGGRGGLGRTIYGQGWRRFLELNLRGRELDAFVRSVLPLSALRGCKLEQRGERSERKHL